MGKAHVEKFGSQTAVLVKLLDSSERLTIQVHPDRQFAECKFQSRFGKTEAWYVLSGRTMDGEEPYVLFGFKPGVTAEAWKTLFESQDIPGMIDALHRIPVREGDIFLVEGGVPHAIGSGCFLIEIKSQQITHFEQSEPHQEVTLCRIRPAIKAWASKRC